ncbi:MAG: ABC transporter ATP-binding protein [Bacteroidetes bacterium]|nr:ABC transporter ATP-binding protein [Bacteroidota bacterium]
MNTLPPHNDVSPINPVVDVSSLSKSYGTLVALDNVSFSVSPGQVFCLVGPNGAGKTTLIDCILGLKSPNNGSIKIFGYSIEDDSHRKKCLSSIGVQFQQDSMYEDIQVEEALHLYATMYQAPIDIQELMSLFRIEHLRKKSYKTLSGGEQRKLLIAITLVGDPKLVFLDEPTSNLDPHARKELWHILGDLRKRGLTIFLSTHNMEEAQEQSDIICLIDSGKIIAQGNIESLLEKFQLEFKFAVGTEDDLIYLNELPNVTQVVKDSTHTLVYGRGDSFVESISGTLQSKGISKYSVGPANLEDLFLLSTKKPES